MRNLEVRFKRAPATPGEVEVVAAEVPPLANGGILCHAHWLAADALFAPLADHPAVFGGVGIGLPWGVAHCAAGAIRV